MYSMLSPRYAAIISSTLSKDTESNAGSIGEIKKLAVNRLHIIVLTAMDLNLIENGKTYKHSEG
jgi:hypothetical protein